ncbi:2-oxoacid:ferredoxin oxidoreductase subunit gamma [bacterium]|nr:2-oxoacid:ferredoxin oxidoreductase subunit gamma [bacterium]
MAKRTEIRIAGLGGQGVVLAGVLLGTAAAVYDKKHVVQTQSYGAEARGGAARSEVIISDSPIIYPKVLEPDIIVAMSQTALDKYIGDLKTNGTLFIDEELVTTLPERNNFKIHKARFSEAASQELGRSIVANMIMLGFLTSLTEITSAEAITEAIRNGVPKGTEELNLKALELGREMAVR